jgi:hypothetical protein
MMKKTKIIQGQDQNRQAMPSLTKDKSESINQTAQKTKEIIANGISIKIQLNLC